MWEVQDEKLKTSFFFFFFFFFWLPPPASQDRCIPVNPCIWAHWNVEFEQTTCSKKTLGSRGTSEDHDPE